MKKRIKAHPKHPFSTGFFNYIPYQKKFRFYIQYSRTNHHPKINKALSFKMLHSILLVLGYLKPVALSLKVVLLNKDSKYKWWNIKDSLVSVVSGSTLPFDLININTITSYWLENIHSTLQVDFKMKRIKGLKFITIGLNYYIIWSSEGQNYTAT